MKVESTSVSKGGTSIYKPFANRQFRGEKSFNKIPIISTPTKRNFEHTDSTMLSVQSGSLPANITDQNTEDYGSPTKVGSLGGLIGVKWNDPRSPE